MRPAVTEGVEEGRYPSRALGGTSLFLALLLTGRHFPPVLNLGAVSVVLPCPATMTDAITPMNAALEGRSTLERQLGEGGMGEANR